MDEVRAGERAARRILTGASGLLIAAVVVVNASVVTAGPASSFPIWYVLLTATSAAVTCAAGLAAPVLDIGGLRTMTGASVVLYGAVVLLLPVAAAGGDVGRMPWMVTASSAAVAAALVAGDLRLGWATAGLGAVAGVVYRLRFGGFDLDGIVNDSHALLTAAVICVIGAHVISVGAGLDQAASARRAAAARESAERGRLAARTQAAALVHDEVLATLALAASDLPVPRDRLAAQARRAVSMVARLVDDGADEPLSLEVALAAEARRHGAAFEASVDASTAPSDIVRAAVVGATRQALGNAVRHAAGAGLTLRLRVVQGVVEVEIADAGCGFDPAAVADDRLGIRQSIVGRMSRLPGGSALVRSAPGEGTLIRLRVAPESIPEVESAGDQRTLRRGIVVIGAAFVVLQTLCAAAAAVAAPGAWPTQALLLAGVLVTAMLLPRTPARAPAWGWSVLVTGLVVGGTALAVATAPFTYGPLWAVVAFSFLLVALGLRGRTGTALVGALLVAAVVTTGGVAAGASAGQIIQLTARPALLVAVAVVLLMVVERMQRRIAALHREALSDAESESWSLAARAELSERTDELARTVVPVLARIAEARPDSGADRSEYAAWEGRLRDGLRAGALSRDPLRAAVAEARGRGVDVLLLDDTGDHLPDAALEPVLAWMAIAVAQARHRVVGRLHPPGRETWASVAVDGRRLVFDGGAQGASISFQGE